MALLKTAVFIASRFGEFRELRQRLSEKMSGFRKMGLSPINLDDGNVGHQPPLVECLTNVRRSEFLILLLGDEYGTRAPGSEKSYTHLEYDEAVRPGSGTRVLVFCVGASYEGGRIRPSQNPTFAAWQRQVSERHTVGFLDAAKSPADLANEIFIQRLGAGLIPFPPLTRAEAGTVVRLKGSSAAQYEAEFGRKIEFIDDLPASIAPQQQGRATWVRLYRLTESTADRVLLSRAGAYQLNS